MNTTPDKVTEIKFLEITAADVKANDIIATGAERDTIVHNVKIGRQSPACACGECSTKWVELRDVDGKLIMRVEASAILTVGREFETDESKARQRTAQNEAIREFIAKRVVNSATLKALAVLTEQAEKGYFADSFKTSDLLAAQAADKVHDVFTEFVTNTVGRTNKQTGEIIDETAAWEAYVEVLKRRLLVGDHIIRGLSRSTSMVSNLMDDAEREATVEFIRHGARWWF